MAVTGKDHARVNLDIWNDDAWLDLTPPAQHLYLVLWTSAGLSYCGAGEWKPGKIAQRARGWSGGDVESAGAELSRELFIIIDVDTEEFLLRSWVKHDGLWRTPNMAVSMANARADLASRTLRGVVVHEVAKIRKAHPDSSSWKRIQVANMLTQKPVDPSELEPLTLGVKGRGQPIGLRDGVNPRGYQNLTHGVNPTSNPAPTPAPAPTTFSNSFLSQEGESESEAPMILIPDDWAPNDLHRAKYPRPDLDALAEGFRDHALSTGRRCHLRAGWDAAFSNWVRKSKPVAANGSTTDARIAQAQALKLVTPSTGFPRGQLE